MAERKHSNQSATTSIVLGTESMCFCGAEGLMFVPGANLVHTGEEQKLRHVPVGAPLERVAVDIMGPLPRTDNDNEYLLVVGDYFTKWAEAYPLKYHTAQTVADVMVREFVAHYGLPRSLPTRVGSLSPS